MNLSSSKWLDAAKILSSNKNAKIECPECSVGILTVKDVKIIGSDKIDRYMICNNCGKWNVITM